MGGTAMTIEIKPETEQLLNKAIHTGRFRNIDDLIARAIQSLQQTTPENDSVPAQPRKSLAQFLLDSPPADSALYLESTRPRAEAVAHIRQARIGNRLPPGVTIEDLINEGRA
jgi:Arc/MetJ-type ribon-helix-helix transcriptional regulator